MSNATPEAEELASFAFQCVILFCTLQFTLSSFKIPQIQINCLVSLFHHVGICAYSLLYNYSFMTQLVNVVQSSFPGSTLALPCDTPLFSTPAIYYSGTFTIVYLTYDMIFDLMPHPSKNKLLIFHHINGVGLIGYALVSHYGQYMVYISHIMELSSIFLSLKELLKYYGVPEGIRLGNDLAFAASFLVVRVYMTLASVFTITAVYRGGCITLSSISLLDGLIVYTTILYICLTLFWSYGILKKMYGVLTGTKSTKAKKQA
mmetsp:Transcript_2526/g.4581  ORF Transcript_2526/g.4581 Transcript_2526/m.4581 type:complete len:261 (+) Transcript_2526:96-878(+)